VRNKLVSAFRWGIKIYVYIYKYDLIPHNNKVFITPKDELI